MQDGRETNTGVSDEYAPALRLMYSLRAEHRLACKSLRRLAAAGIGTTPSQAVQGCASAQMLRSSIGGQWRPEGLQVSHTDSAHPMGRQARGLPQSGKRHNKPDQVLLDQNKVYDIPMQSNNHQSKLTCPTTYIKVMKDRSEYTYLQTGGRKRQGSG